jgi:hypothetical protein
MEDSRRGSDRGRATRHPVGKRFWPISKAERREIKQLFETEMSKLATMLRSRDDDAPVKLLDAAYWMKGCSSLGRLRYAVILRIGSKDQHRPQLCVGRGQRVFERKGVACPGPAIEALHFGQEDATASRPAQCEDTIGSTNVQWPMPLPPTTGRAPLEASAQFIVFADALIPPRSRFFAR